MKKFHYLPMCILLTAIVFAVSCTKQSAPLGSGSTPIITPVDPTPVEIGSVVDLGLINPDTRVMSSTLQTQNFSILGNNGNVSGANLTVSLKYYVNQDAQIPAGQYVYSNSDSKAQFTFDSAMISGAVDSTGYAIPSQNIVDGSVAVTQEGNTYQFALQGTLESGSVFSGTAKGTITYADNNLY